MTHWQKTGLQVALALVFLGSLLWLSLTPRNIWLGIWLLYGVAFGAYLAAGSTGRGHLGLWLMIALVARVIMLFSFPNLSDDVYRFIWDGHLWLQGINPFGSTPAEIMAADIDPTTFSTALFNQLNSPEYHTVYPAFPQATFVVAAWIAGNDWFWNAFVLKCFLFGAECLTLRYMYIVLPQDRKHLVLLYALNPLVIIELTGNIHFEAFMILGLVAAFAFLRQARQGAAAGALLLAIGSKLLPVLAIPLLLRRISLRRLMKLGAMIGIGCLLIFLPVFLAWNSGFAESIGLYFQTFEFNASVYYVVRYIGFQLRGYNTIATIGPWLFGVTLLCLCVYLVKEKKPVVENWPGAVLIVLAIYLTFATTVHPWYVCPLVAMSVLSKWRFPVVWSGVVFLSYTAYSTEVYTENLLLVGIEYAVVAAAVIADVVHNRRQGQWEGMPRSG